jgi:hypothetical protein
MTIKSKLSKGILIATVMLFTSSYSIGQETTKEKLDNVKEDVDKITITASDEEVTFEGDEAKKLFKKMKSSSHTVNSYFIKEDVDSFGTKKIIIKSDRDAKIYEFNKEHGDHMVWYNDEGEIRNMEKRVKVDVENGEEKTEVYEGAEADEYLGKMKSEHGGEMLIEIDEDGSSKKIKKNNYSEGKERIYFLLLIMPQRNKCLRYQGALFLFKIVGRVFDCFSVFISIFIRKYWLFNPNILQITSNGRIQPS